MQRNTYFGLSIALLLFNQALTTCVVMYLCNVSHAAVIKEWGGVWELHSHPTLPLIPFTVASYTLCVTPNNF